MKNRWSVPPISPHFARALVLLSLMIGASFAASANIYDVNLTVGTTGSVTGTITTNGALGPLSLGDILGWNLTVSDGIHSPAILNSGNSGVYGTANDATATANQILFNFNIPDEFYFEGGSPSGFVCFGISNGGCAFGNLGDVTGINDQGYELNTPLMGIQPIAGTASATPEPNLTVVGAIWFAFMGVMAVMRHRNLARQSKN
jgi:hypothetical protein